MDIDSDANKARGFLVTYSTLVLLAWYFDAQLTSLSILGNSIVLKSNIENVWLVMAIANIYFILRFCQKLPEGALHPDTNMTAISSMTLCRATEFVYRHYIRHQAAAWIANETNEKRKLTNFKARSWIALKDEQQLNSLSGMHVGIGLSVVEWETLTQKGATQPGPSLYVKPNMALTIACYVFAFVKGALYRDWFTDRVLPIFYGGLATGAAFSNWFIAH